MVKLWGYNSSALGDSDLPLNYQRKFFTQKKRRVADSSSRRIVMKLPSLYSIQRMLIARQLMFLNQPQVRQGQRIWPKKFEDYLTRYRKLGLNKRAHRPNGIRKVIRKRRVVEELEEQELDRNDSHGSKWDMEALSYKHNREEINRLAEQKTSHGEKEEAHEQMKEEKRQRQQWLSNLIRDLKSDRVNEILANYRMVTDSEVGIQPLYTIYQETVRYSLKTHDWAMICKCLCGIADECRTKKSRRSNSEYPSTLYSFWMLGFLAIINHYKDDVSKLEKFSRDVRTLFGGNPLWIGSNLATWLIQKGHFMKAYRILDEYSLETLAPKSRIRHDHSPNPKREMATFLNLMIKAVHLYCIWRKEETMPEIAENEDDDARIARLDALRRKGESALAAFELCYDKYQIVEGDAMCFLQPFIELVVEFRSVQRAREILEQIFNLNDGNYFVENFYVEFLEDHYSESEIDLINFLRRRTHRKFNFEEKDSKVLCKKGRRQIKQWKDAKCKNGEMVSTMKQVCKPAFAW